MQLCDESLGFAFDSDSIALPESLSEIVTVPDANEFPLFDVVAENAEKVPTPVAIPQHPATSSVSRIRRVLVVRSAHTSRLPVPRFELQRHVIDAALITGRRREG